MINKPKKFIPLIALIFVMLLTSSALGNGPSAYSLFFFEYAFITIASTFLLFQYKWTVATSFFLFSIAAPVISWFMSYDLIIGSGEFRGWLAEIKVSKKLKKLEKQNPEKYRIFNEIIIQDKMHSSEIDHIVVSNTGVFVIETKAFENIQVDDEGNWLSGYKKKKIKNPVEQNIGHIHALKKTIGDKPYFSIVVLTESPSPRECKGVINIRDLIKSIKDQNKQLLSQTQVNEIIDQLNHYQSKSKEAKKEHLRRVQKKERVAQRVS